MYWLWLKCTEEGFTRNFDCTGWTLNVAMGGTLTLGKKTVSEDIA